MRRREFITLLAGTAAVWPLAARAQQGMPVVGFVSSGSAADAESRLRPFRQGLNDAGYVEGRNVRIEYRFAEGRTERLPELIADLIRLRVAAIASSADIAQLALAATRTIPIVFSTGGDPVQMGLVASLNRPGGNVTGITSLTAEVAPKRLELLHEVLPQTRVISVLCARGGIENEAQLNDLQAAARSIGVELKAVQASDRSELATVFSELGRQPDKALVIGAGGFFIEQIEYLGALALRHAVPAVYTYREFAAAGGLMSYGGPSNTVMARQSGVYVGRILKGEKPADLPVQQFTKIGLIINLKSAKALGIAMPPELLVRADEVIE